MKQRLLLCLLMLMVSVGLVKAADNGDITINILQGETAKIEFTSDGKFKVGTEKSYPTIDGCTPSDKSTTSSVIYEITADKDNPKTVTINKEAADFWGNVGINISGKVTSFAVKGPNDKGIDGTDMTNLVSHITSITFTNNGELNNLDLGTGFALTNYLPALKTLSCPDNQLKAFPAEGEGQTFTIGKQNSSTATIAGVTDGNPRSLKLTSSVLSGLSFADNAFDGTNLRIISLTTQKDQQGDKIPYDFDEVNSIWHFRDAKTGVYVDGGDYWATIQIVGGAYDGLEIWNVPINLKDATFTLDTKNLVDKTNGNNVTVKVTRNGNEITDLNSLQKGDRIEMIPQPAAGYVFDKFDEANMKGLKRIEGTEGNRWVYEVLGNDDPVIKALFTYGEDVLTFNTSNSGGTLKVYQSTDGKYTNDKELSSGTKLTVGTEITIVATANEGQSFSDILLNDKSILNDNESKLDREFKYTTEVVAGGMNIIATFASQKVAFTVERNTGWGQFDIFNDETNKQYSPKSNTPNSENEFTFKNIPANTTLRIEMKLQKPEEQYIKKLAMNGTDYLSSITKLDDDRYVLKYLWTGSNSIRLVAEWATLEDITVTVDETSLVYNGDYQAIKYTVSPASLTNEVKVTYRENESDTYEPGTPFKEVGEYYVVFSREQKNPYKKLEKVVKYSITPAPLYITGTPVVTTLNNVYAVSGLKAQYYQNGKLVPEEGVAGEFRVVDISTPSSPTEVEQVPAGMEDGGVVNIRFYAEDGTNFENSGVVAIHKVAYGTAKNSIAVEAIESEGLGDTELIMKSASGLIGSEVQDDTKIDFEIINPDPILKKNNMYHVYLVDGEGNILDGEGDAFLTYGYVVNKAAIEQGELIFRLDVDGRNYLAVSDAAKDELTETVTYDGEVQSFPVDDLFPLVVKETGKKLELGSNNENLGTWDIVYRDDETDQIVLDPKNVGTYKVEMTRKATSNFYEFKTTGTLIIEQAELPANSIPAPTATQVTKGSPLWYSHLDGPVSILGYYDWAEEEKYNTVTETGTHRAVFIPQDENYATYELPGVVNVQVTDAAVLSISWTGYGSVYATDKAGNTYWGGDEILPGTELTIHATPNTDCYLVSLTKDGVAIANGASFTFEDEPVSIYAEFEIYVPESIIPDPEPADPVIDEDSQYIVEVKKATTNSRGFILGKEGENGVYYTKSFEFTVNALDADLDKLVVTGATKVSKGKYRINSVTSNTTVTVSLPNPTPIDVKIVTESKNTKGYLVGKVKAEQYPLDGKCYYGDELVVVAYPVDGVSFAHWRDNTSNRDQMREITVTKAMTIEAVFSGVPTGIEDVESAGIYAGRGYIQVKNVSNADLTVVSISGRIQTRQHLEGDVQVRVPAGVYVVVLENGQDVKRVKVIVR